MGELGRFRAREDSRHAALEAWDERARNTSAERSLEFIELALQYPFGGPDGLRVLDRALRAHEQ